MRSFSYFFLGFLSLGVAGYAFVAYLFFPLGNLVHPDMKAVFQLHPIGIYLHIFFAAVALAVGPFQFSNKLRQKYLSLHRWSGRIYLSSVLIGGTSALYMAQFSYGGLMSHFGFGFLALAWLSTGFMAYRAIKSGDIPNHRRWMTRNYALTFAAVTLRIYLGIFFASGVPFEIFYPLISWLCWVPNLFVAESILRLRNGEIMMSH